LVIFDQVFKNNIYLLIADISISSLSIPNFVRINKIYLKKNEKNISNSFLKKIRKKSYLIKLEFCY